MLTESKDQQSLEREMARLGRDRYKRKRNTAEDRGLETTTAAGRWLLANAIEPLENALGDWVRLAKSRPGRAHRAVAYYEQIDLSLAAALIARAVLDAISTRKKMTRTAMQIAGILEDECRFQSVAVTDKGLWRDLHERTKEYSGYTTKRRHIIHGMNKAGAKFQSWPAADKLQIGVVALDLMHSSTGLIEIHQRMTMFGWKRTEVVATDTAMKWLQECHARSEILTPLFMPCLELPRDWVSPTKGGFHSPQEILHKRALVKTTDNAYMDELAYAEMPEVYQAVNTLQQTEFHINSAVAEIMRHFWNANLEVGKLPIRDDKPVPERPVDIDTNAVARKAWRRQAAAVHDHNAVTRAERLAVAKVLNLTEKFEGETISYVAQLDWRGRVYPIAYHLHPQGPDWVKALLLFAKGDKLDTPEAVRWFRIAGANLKGLDKASFDERVQWTKDNHQAILDVAENPIGERQFWEDSDSPWCFLAWILEYKKYQEQGADYESAFAVHQDATQSGVQLMSLLLRDSVGAEATNCTPSERPQDLYGAVADSVISILQERPDDLVAQMWLDFGITRQTTKRVVMVRPYNGGLYSALRYIREWANDNGGLPVSDDFSACFYLAKTIWLAMDAVMGGTQRTMAWLGEVAEICVSHGLPVRWTSPVGFPVKQTYHKTKLRSIKTMIGDTLRKHSLRQDLPELDTRRMKNGLAPNFIHSLDAAALMRTVTLSHQRGVTQFALVHDSFATTPAHSAALAKSIREAYLDLFRNDVLADFKKEVEVYLPEGAVLPELPTYGDLDIEKLSESLYFFN